MTKLRETELYAPVKAHLEAAGYEVKAEVGSADVVGVAGEAIVVVELKAGFSLKLLQQAVARQALTDSVYVAVPRWKGRTGWQAFKGNIALCRRLCIGVLSVRLEDGRVEVHADPKPFAPRKSPARRARLLGEFARRTGDPNTGGTGGQTGGKIVTAYRQDAEKLAAFLAEHGPSKGAIVARATGVARATEMMRTNHYGWFERISPGIYGLAAAGRAAMSQPTDAGPAAAGKTAIRD